MSTKVNSENLIKMNGTKFPEEINHAEKVAIEIFQKLYDNPELSSEEYNSANLIVSKLRENGIEPTENFLGMSTSFIAVYGSGAPVISIFAEYDALPIGHACGHNIIAGWAVGTFLAVAKSGNFKGTLILVGSPAEEGRGNYASSKIKIAPKLKEMGVDIALCIHPGDEWKVLGNYYARWRNSFTFSGKESHAAGSPEKGINALDPAVSFYSSVRAIRNQLSPDTPVIVSEIIKEGGVAVNIIPSKAEVWVDIRTLDIEYLNSVASIVEEIAKGEAMAGRCKLSIKQLAPVTASFKENQDLDNFLYKYAHRVISQLPPPGTKVSRPIGSSDVGNISQIIPTAQLIVKTAKSGTSLHSSSFLKSAGSELAKNAMVMAIRAMYLTITNYSGKIG